MSVVGATGTREISGRMASERVSQRAFLGISALLFAASVAVTVAWCSSMSAMGGMTMPGGWTMSMAWMRMPGQTWPAAAASFLAMWLVMMVAMMMPSLVPMLWRYRQAVGGTGEPRLGRMTALVGVGYFLVWSVFGMAAFPLGIALARIEMKQPAVARAVPIVIGVVVLMAGFLQVTAWKGRHLACCRGAPGRGCTLPADAGTAWRHGLRLGLHCSQCCAGLIAILLVLGVMDLARDGYRGGSNHRGTPRTRG
jgi:predicted metal-binding membrane protein